MITGALHRRIVACIVAVELAIIGCAGLMIWQARAHALEQAKMRAEGLVHALDHHAARAFESIGISLSVIVNRLGAGSANAVDPAAMHRLLREREIEAPQIRGFVVFDAEGVAIHDAATLPPRKINVADQSFFQQHRERSDLGLLFGPPFLSPSSSEWIVVVSRRFDKPDGTFGGVVSASLDLRYFQEFYQTVKPGVAGSVSLGLSSGELLVQEPAVDAARGAAVGTQLGYRLSEERQGFFEAENAPNGETRLISYRRLSKLPLIVVVSIAKAEALAEWRVEAWRTGAAAMVLVLVTAVVMLLLLKVLRKLEREKTIVETILRSLPDGVQLLDADLKLAASNDHLFEILALDREAVLVTPDPAATIRRIRAGRGDYGAGDVDTLLADRAKLLTSDQPVRYRRRLPNGRWMECRGTPLSGRGFLSVYRDVTEEVQNETEQHRTAALLARQTADLARTAEELRVARQEAIEARDAAEFANRAKSGFLANMSHELRTPLNAVLGFSEIIAGQHFGVEAGDRYAVYAVDIMRSGQHLLGLINNVLDLSKVEAGRMELLEETIDLDACIEDAMMMVGATADEKGLQIDFRPAGGPTNVRADEQKLRQSFINVLSNAVKFTPEGGKVTVAVHWLPREVAIRIRDTGIGIAAEDRWRVFTAFSQIDSSIARQSKGTGLGMPLTQRLIELHGGRIELESEVGKGTEFTLYLPIERFERPRLRSVG